MTEELMRKLLDKSLSLDDRISITIVLAQENIQKAAKDGQISLEDALHEIRMWGDLLKQLTN